MTLKPLHTYLLLGAVAALALIAPFYIYPVLLMKILCFAIFAHSLNLLLGYGGLVSFGHAMFFGMGSYISAYSMKSWGWNPELGILAAGAVTAAMGAAVGAIAIRRQGIYLAMISLAFAQMVYFLVLAIPEYGGTDGLMLPERNRLLDLPLDGDQPLYWLALMLLIGFLLIAQRTMEARFGLALRGARQNERRMRALGYPVYRIRLLAFAISGAAAGLAGAVLANQAGFVSPDLLSWQRSGELIMMVILGGQGTLFGPVLGAFALLLLEEELSAVTEHWMLVLGPILLLCVLFFRRGLWGQISGAPAHG